MRFGQTTYEVIRPFEDVDSGRFKSSSSILKVTLSLAFKHPAKELTAPEKREDDIESYFYKVANEYELVKAVCSNRDVIRRFFNQQKFKVNKKTLSKSKSVSDEQEQQQNGDLVSLVKS